MRCLITGSCGFLGSHLVDHILRTTDWEVVGIDSFRHRGDALRINDSDEKIKRYKVICHDLNAPITPYIAKAIGEVDYIVNVASQSDVLRSIKDPVPFVQNNINVALYALEYAKEYGCKRFIQISTDEVYGAAPDPVAFVEWSRILPSNPYAASKASQEALAISYWRSYEVPLQIVNCMNLFGERQDKEKYIPMLISRISAGKTVEIHGSRQDPGKRGYLHARNFASGIMFMLGREHTPYREETNGEIICPDRFNIVGTAEVDNFEMASLIAGYVGRPDFEWKFVSFEESRPGHDKRYALDGTKLAALGWVPPVPFTESLRRTVQWTLQNSEWL